MDRSERFHKIDRLLKDRPVVPMQLFLDELEVSHATVKRDIEYMRDRLHAPIEWDVKRRGYHYTEQSQFSLPGLWLNAAEIQAFLLMEDQLICPRTPASSSLCSSRAARAWFSSSPTLSFSCRMLAHRAFGGTKIRIRISPLT